MEKKDFTMAEYATLPSLGKVYGLKVAPEIHLSSMTTKHEMQRLTPSESQFKVLCDIIDDCLIENPGISSYDMCSGDYQFLMFKLREVTYGKDVKVHTRCPHCGAESDVIIDLNLFKVHEYSDLVEACREFILPKTGKTIKLKLQTPRMLDKVAEDVKEMQTRTGQKNNYTLIYTIKEMIETVDGKKPNPINIDNWIQNLPMMDTNVLLQKATKLDSLIGIDTSLEFICDDCGKEYASNFQITSEFFRPEIDF